MIYLLTSIG